MFIKTHKRTITPILLSFGLVGLSALSYLNLISPQTFADNSIVEDDIVIYIPSFCSLDSIVNADHTDTINNGTHKSNIGTTTLKVFCNDNNGFSIYAAGYTGEEIGGGNSTKLVGNNNTNIITGTALSGNTSNWAMKLTTDPNAAYPLDILSDTDGSYASESYHIVPAASTKVATRSSNTDAGPAAAGSVLTTTYQVYISPSQPAGTYTGNVIYTLVHPANPIIPAVVCDPSATTISQAKCLQDFAGPNRDQIVASMTAETQYILKDSRDGKSYTIAKYQVGAANNYDVWMTQNLDLDLDSTKAYTNLDTDLGYNATTGEYETMSWSPTASTHITSDTTWNYSGVTAPESYDPGDLYWNGTLSDGSDYDAYFNRCHWDSTTQQAVCDEISNPRPNYIASTGIPQYHLGNYYNWTAAIAANEGYGIDNESVDQSICPAGWTLPRTGNGEDTFYALLNQYGFSASSTSGNNSLWESPLYFVASSDGNNGDESKIGTGGSFWSSVQYHPLDPNFNHYDASTAYILHIYHTDVYPSGEGSKDGGQSIRCIARPVTSTMSWSYEN